MLKECCEYEHLKKIKIKPRVKHKIIFLSFKEYAGLKILLILFSILREICKRRFAGPQNSYNMECTELQELYLNHLTL